ncbi:MAG: hypothetical protein ABI950_07720 [Solirubrobacteraceae bacterium]
MQSSGSDPRRPWGPAARDAALRRTRRVTRLIVVATAGLSGTFSVVAAQAFKGHAPPKAGRAPAVEPTATAPAPDHVPAIAPTRHRRLRAPSAPPAAAPAPAPAPPPPPPVVSGGS